MRLLPLAGLAALGAAAAGGFLVRSGGMEGPGFPLDDAWIHQTVARNLAERAEWAFLPGRPGSASTSPLWTGLLSLGHAADLEPRAWAYVLGAACLVLLAWLARSWFLERGTAGVGVAWMVGALVAAEWHLVWASVSGMEIALLAVAALFVLREIDRPAAPGLRIGLAIGAAVWIRPEALLLLGAVAWRVALESWMTPRAAASSLLRVLAAAAVPFGLYLLFHFSLSGEIWPATFFAKSAEYAEYRGAPITARLVAQALPPLVGVGVALLPGIFLGGIVSLRNRAATRLAPLAWILLHWSAYAVQLPVNYQHGRYAMPTIVVLLVLGWEGLVKWVRKGGGRFWTRVVGRAWAGTVVASAAAFWWIGARAYALDVAIIETEMVAASRWVAEHTDAGARVAAHDIGALGFFGKRDVLDLAGLASAEVVPFLRDEQRLAAYLDEQGADYLVTFPGWYLYLTSRAEQVYTSGASFSPSLGGENMAIYRWRRPTGGRGQTAVLYSSPGEARRWKRSAF